MHMHNEFFSWRHDLKARLAANSHMADTRKGPVEYAVRGRETPWPLVFIHGGPGGYDQAFSYLNYMLEEGLPIVSWSRPGYLRTPLTAGKTMKEQADLLAALLDFLDIESVSVNAFSAGGPVALEFAIQYPDRIHALILESAVTRRYEPETGIQRLLFHFFLNDPVTWLCNLLAEYAPEQIIKSFIDIESDFDEQTIRDLLQQVMRDPEKEQVMMGMIKSISPFSLRKKGLENDLDQLAKLAELPLEKIKTPVLILHGRHDAEVSPDHPEYALNKIPASEIIWVPDGMHELSLSGHLDEIKKRKMDFLNTHHPLHHKKLPYQGN